MLTATMALRSASTTASASLARSPPLVLTAASLKQLLSSPTPPVLLDCSWHMPNANPPRDPYKEYLACRIPGARWWDVEEVSTKGQEVRNLPHMMPSPGTFAKAAAQRGISPSSHVVCYDTHGLFSSPRTAFTFLAFGHKNVSVLNGGLPAWLDEGGETQEGKVEEEVVAEEYPEPKLKEGWVRDFEEMVANARMGGRGEVVLDARSRGR